MKWKELTTVEHVEQLWKESNIEAQYIFKHSTRCGISRMALKRLENEIGSLEVTVHLIDVLQFREISNFVASKSNIVHQSPQLIVLKNKEIIYNQSHHAIEFTEY